MDTLPNGFYLQDNYCYPYGLTSERSFGYIPGAPTLKQSEGMPPVATLMSSPKGAELALTLVWDLSFEVQRQIRMEILKKYPGSTSISLNIGNFSNPQVILTIQEGQQTLHTFGPRPSSGMRPYQTVFQESLTAREKNQAIAAFNGQSGNLIATYQTELNLTAEIQVTISGNIAEDLKELAPKPKKKGWLPWDRDREGANDDVTIEKCRAQVDKSIKAGRLLINREETPNVSDELRMEVENEIKEIVAADIYNTIKQLGSGADKTTQYTVNQTRSARKKLNYSITRSLDIGKWFQEHGGGSNLIQNSPVSLSEPDRI